MTQTTAAKRSTPRSDQDKAPAPRRRTRTRNEPPAAEAPEVPEVQAPEAPEVQVPEPVPEAGATPARRRFKLAAVLAAAVVALLVGALIFSVLRLVGDGNQSSLRSSALKAANRYGVYLSSYDYKNLTGPSAPWTLVDESSTASFKADFDKTRASLSTLVKNYHATATGKVVASGLSSVSSRKAVVLLFIDQTVTNSAQKPGTETQPLRVEVVLARQHGKWLIDKLDVPN